MDEWPRKLLDGGLEVRTEFGWGREDPEGTMDWDTMLELVDCELTRGVGEYGYYAVDGREE